MALIKKIIMTIILIVIVLAIGTILFLNTTRFGKHPTGERLKTIQKSAHYKNGKFENLNETPMLTEGVGYGQVLYEFIFSSKPKEPTQALPSEKTNLKTLNPAENTLIWMGHSSYFMQIDGKKILVDPVLSGNASPLSFTTKAYKGSDIYTTDEIPEIDYLFISHDHWDHMDYKTLIKLKPKVKKVITGLGNGAHLEHWGYDTSVIFEGDWYDSLHPENGIDIHVTPARHFSGRGLKRAQTLWASFVFKTPNLTIYIGGDSGYGTHFSEIGNTYGPFDLAILENGQYDKNWKHIHMMPNQQIEAAKDLKAHTVFPVHSGKFTLANHDWDEPLQNISEAAAKSGTRIITPKIGETVYLDDKKQQFEKWWTK